MLLVLGVTARAQQRRTQVDGCVWYMLCCCCEVPSDESRANRAGGCFVLFYWFDEPR
jgi:hypothetical protein